MKRLPEITWFESLVGTACLIGAIFWQSIPMAIILGSMIIGREIEVAYYKPKN